VNDFKMNTIEQLTRTSIHMGSHGQRVLRLDLAVELGGLRNVPNKLAAGAIMTAMLIGAEVDALREIQTKLSALHGKDPESAKLLRKMKRVLTGLRTMEGIPRDTFEPIPDNPPATPTA